MKTIRLLISVFIILLLISGITAFPIKWEMQFLLSHRHLFPSTLSAWIEQVGNVINETPDIMFYGTDWLAFGHIVIALFFIPIYINPVHYKLNIIIGMIACIAVFPLAFICGPIRGIPFLHQLIDCSFGFFGFALLHNIYKKIKKIEYESPAKK